MLRFRCKFLKEYCMTDWEAEQEVKEFERWRRFEKIKEEFGVIYP